MSQIESRNLSICMLSDDFLPAATGVGTHLQAVSEQLAGRGHRVAIITTRRPGELEEESWRGVDVYRVFTRSMFGFYQALPSRRTLESILNRVRPDLLHHHYLGYMLLQGMSLASKLQIPQVYTYHMTEDHLTQPWIMRPLRPLFRSEIVRRCNRMDAVISVSQNLAAMLPKKGITTKVKYISNPVRFPSNLGLAPAPRKADFVVMFAGRLEPEKNLPLLMKAFSIFQEKFSGRAELWIAGKGSQRERLAQLAETLPGGGEIRFLGFLSQDELACHYLACDVFVLPSLVETQGLVAMEAMWFGKPVILAETIVSASELISSGVNGHIVRHEDPNDLAERLMELALLPDERTKMGQAARKSAQSYRPEVIVEKLEQLYLEVLGRSPSL